MAATITADKKYLFSCNRGDIYWVDAKIIEDLKPKEIKKLWRGYKPTINR